MLVPVSRTFVVGLAFVLLVAFERDPRPVGIPNALAIAADREQSLQRHQLLAQAEDAFSQPEAGDQLLGDDRLGDDVVDPRPSSLRESCRAPCGIVCIMK